MSPIGKVATGLPQGVEAGSAEGGNRVATGDQEVEWQPGCQEQGARA